MSLLVYVAICRAGVPDSAIESRVDDPIEKAISSHLIPGAVVVIGHQDKVIYRKAYGSRALVPQEEAMTVETIFDCASLTKVVVTTTAMMQLYESGKVEIDAPVTRYLPEFQGGTSAITIRDLMTHYSGLRPDLTLEPAWSGHQLGIEKALSDKPALPREKRFVYSDINFILLGAIVERLSGETLDQYAHDHIFEPLGMKHSYFRPQASLWDKVAPTEQLATGQVLRGTVHDPTSRYMGGVAGHAGLFSTADDLALFCRMMADEGVNPSHHHERFLRAETIALFTSPQSPPGSADVRGLGWDINSKYSRNRGELFLVGRSYGHTGFTGTSIWIDPGTQSYVILLTNSVHPHSGKNIQGLRSAVATAAAIAVGYGPTSQVLTGIDVLEAENFEPLKGLRIGLVTNQTGIDRNGARNIDLLRAGGVDVKVIFSPEHGFLGKEDRPDVAGGTDPSTGIKVVSLYGAEKRRPAAVDLAGLDALVFDIADVGARFYTYTTTMAYSMESAARAKIRFFVLDRPNPITGLHEEGPVLDRANESFIGYFPMPVRHGMTMGEMASMFNTENHIGAELEVVRLNGWRRAEWFDETGLKWVDPSPNIRSLNEALLYPGVALLEASPDYSVGRGTDTPFEVIGAPWIHSADLMQFLEARSIPGVQFEARRFTPESNHDAGIGLEGLQLKVTDREAFSSARLGIELAAALQKLYPGRIHFAQDRELIGSEEVRAALAEGVPAGAILDRITRKAAQFEEMRAKYLLYE